MWRGIAQWCVCVGGGGGGRGVSDDLIMVGQEWNETYHPVCCDTAGQVKCCIVPHLCHYKGYAPVSYPRSLLPLDSQHGTECNQ